MTLEQVQKAKEVADSLYAASANLNRCIAEAAKAGVKVEVELLDVSCFPHPNLARINLNASISL